MLDRRDVRNSIIYGLETLVSGVISIIFYILLSRYLAMADIGAYALAIVYATFATSIANVGLVSGYERNYFEFEKQSTHATGTLLLSVQLFSIATISICIFFGLYFNEAIALLVLKDAHYATVWSMVLAAIGFSEISKFYLTYLRNSNLAELYSFLHVIQVFLNLLLSYVFLALLEKDLLGVAAALFISHSVVLVGAFCHQFLTLPLGINFQFLFKALKLSIPLTPRVLIGFFATQFDKIILSILGTLDVLGLYSVAQRIAQSVAMYMNAIGRVYQPKLYRYMFDPDSPGGLGFISTFAVLSLLPAVLLILLSKEVFWIFPTSYGSGYQILIILCCYYSLLYIGKINGPQLMFAEKTWLISGLSFATVSLNMAASYFLVLRYGATGAALGTLISTFFSIGVGFYYAQKYAPINWDFKVITMCYSYVFVSACYVLFVDTVHIALDIPIRLFFVCSFIFVSWILLDLKVGALRQSLRSYLKGDGFL